MINGQKAATAREALVSKEKDSGKIGISRGQLNWKSRQRAIFKIDDAHMSLRVGGDFSLFLYIGVTFYIEIQSVFRIQVLTPPPLLRASQLLQTLSMTF